MTREELVHGYANFFKSEAGIDLLKELDRQIEESHRDAEENPDMAGQLVMRAKAAREIREHINRMCIAGKKVIR